MNERLPYEEQLTQQWNDLPLPDENMAWGDMKRRLEEDDDKGVIPIWLRGCGLWGGIAVILLGLGWWFFTQYTSDSKKDEAQKVQDQPHQVVSQETNNNDTSRIGDNQPGGKTNPVHPATGKKNQDDSPPSVKPDFSPDKEPERKTETNPDVSIAATKTSLKKTSKTDPGKRRSIQEKKIPVVKQVIEKDNADISTISGSTKTGPGITKAPPIGKTETIVTDSSIHPATDTIKSDSSLTIKKDSLKKDDKQELTKNAIPKKDSAKQKSISFSAGIAENQLLPIDGQKLTPYNAQGRKSTLADYIPSVYFRMYKDGKWFLQSEFRYGAPQYNREFVYSEKSKQDTSGTFSLITSTKLKKTFYHQLPVSFNYFVLPNWSIGTGFVWNFFNSAVSTQDVVKRIPNSTLDTVVSLGTVVRNKGADSNFAKSYFQAIVETQYKWKRFSLGARYAFGLEPYIKFTLPGGGQQQEKNRSLQVFLRYELWKSKKIILKK